MVLIKNMLHKLEDTLAEQMLSRDPSGRPEAKTQQKYSKKKLASYLYLITNNTQKQE